MILKKWTPGAHLLLKCYLKGKTVGNWQMDRILIIPKKENGPKASSAPALGLNTIIFKYVFFFGIWSISQVRVYRTIGTLVWTQEIERSHLTCMVLLSFSFTCRTDILLRRSNLYMGHTWFPYFREGCYFDNPNILNHSSYLHKPYAQTF